MRNLAIFIKRYFNFFLFLVLEIICLSLVFNNNDYQRTAWLHSSNAFFGYLFGQANRVNEYFHLGEINDSLSAQNARLLNRLPGAFEVTDSTVGIKADSLGNRQYRYFPAKIVNNSVSHLFNYLTIHRGREQGIKPGMGVIGPSGVVGVVRYVSDHYAVVMSLLNKDARISALLPRGHNFGSVVWNFKALDPRYGLLMDIPKNMPVKEGDTVLTSGYSAIFPPGLTIGYVTKVAVAPSSNFYQIDIRFATHFQSLQYVYAIENLNAEEQKNLEGNIRDE